MQLNYFEKLRLEYKDVEITETSQKTSQVTPETYEKIAESKKMNSDNKLANAKDGSYENVFTNGSVSPVPMRK